MRRTIHLCQRDLKPLRCLACGEVAETGDKPPVNRRWLPAICVSRVDWDTTYRDHAEYRRCIDPLTAADRPTDRRRPTPTEPGWYWAEWRVCEDGTEDEDGFQPTGPEVVEVWDNTGSFDTPRDLYVSVSGIAKRQGLDCFVWLSNKLEVPV